MALAALGSIWAEAAMAALMGLDLATTRGVIRDAYGRVLAANRPSYSVYVTPGQLDMEKVWPLLVKLVRLDDSERQNLETKIKERRALADKDPGRMRQLLVKVDVESFEMDVLQGGRKVFAERGTPLFLEIHNQMMRERGLDPAALIDQLISYGYRSFQLGGRELSPKELMTGDIVRILARR